MSGKFQTMTVEPRRPVAAVGVICLREAEVLLIRRANPPRVGEWSLPGGRIEWGERAETAAVRELHEETGVEAELLGLVAVIDGLFPEAEPQAHYLLVDYAARWTAGEPRAGDDAAEAQFFPLEQVGGLGLWRRTQEVILDAAARFGP